jgi:outer membrane protein insertion porin family
MRTKLLALLIMLLCIGGVFAQTADDWYQNKPIRTITFEGLRNVARSELDGLFSSYLGKNFNDELYWDILQKLYALEYFEEITPVALPGDPSRNTVMLQFTVTEKPTIKNVKFVGNKKIRSADLLDKVTLKEGDIYNELKSRLDERAVRDFYLEKGYASVKVVSEAIPTSEKTFTLQFSVTEGKQTVVSSINFEGNNVMAAKTLRKVMELKETKLLNSGTFRESVLEADKAAIRSYYIERGYVDAVVETVIREMDAESTEDKNLLKLTFVIKEGEQYVYGGTVIDGNKIFTAEELLAKIKMKEGDVLNLNRFNEGYQAIADLYFENGYTSNYINRKENRDTDRKRISFVITIVESTRSHVEHIIIKGNTKTKERVISREFLLEPGDIFSKTKLLDSVRNLYNLRYFSAVAPDLVPGSEANLVDVVIALEEQSTASIQFGVTFSGVTDAEAFPLSVFAQWEDKNLFGNGQTVSANVTVSPDTQSVALGFSQNWFLGSPLTVSFNLSFSHKQLYAYQDVTFPLFDDDFYDEWGIVPDPFTSLEEYENASSLDDSYRMKYDRWEYGIGASTGYRWNPPFATATLRGGINFSVVQNFYDAVIYRPADKGIRDEQGQWGWNNSVWTRFSLDSRNLNYDPSKGWFASEQVTLYGLIPKIETEYYIRSDAKGEVYFTLLDYPLTESWNLKFVIAGYTGLSFLRPANDEPISDSNKLYIDGMFTGRGWSSLYKLDTARGNMMINHWIELRMPLAPGVIAADFFLDSIAIKSELEDITSLSLNDYYFSYGPGVRFSIPQFPLRLMLANTFRIQNGDFEWGNGEGPDWKFVLSFNIANL